MSSEPQIWFLDLCVLVCLLAGWLCFATQPKRDRRYKTGYVDNQEPNVQQSIVGFVLIVLAVVLLCFRPSTPHRPNPDRSPDTDAAAASSERPG